MNRLLDLICRCFHSWGHPVHGHWICMDCGRKHKTPIS